MDATHVESAAVLTPAFTRVHLFIALSTALKRHLFFTLAWQLRHSGRNLEVRQPDRPGPDEQHRDARQRLHRPQQVEHHLGSTLRPRLHRGGRLRQVQRLLRRVLVASRRHQVQRVRRYQARYFILLKANGTEIVTAQKTDFLVLIFRNVCLEKRFGWLRKSIQTSNGSIKILQP